MTKYQIAQIKRAIKKEISKENKIYKVKNHVINRGSLPDYIAKNPWY